MDILAAIRRAIAKYDLFDRESTVVVGVSGGPDSVCLLHALRALAAEYDLHLHVAHLNHQLRGDEAKADVDFVRDLAQQWNVPCTIEARDVKAFAQAHKLSIEEAARQLRYGFLIEVASALGSDVIAVAHNADDQAESVLMHFLRGSGLAGLRGMPSKFLISDFGFWIPALQSEIQNLKSKIYLVRPLLDVPRTAIEEYCAQYHLGPRIDATNADTTYFRNRLRHELLPLLETVNPNLRSILRHTASVFAADYEVLEQQTALAWGLTVKDESATAVTFDLAVWREQPLATQRALLRQAIHQLHPPLRDINFVHIEDTVDVLQRATTGDQVTLPQNLLLEVGYAEFTITPRDQLALPDWPQLSEDVTSIPISVLGTTPLPESEWVLETTSLAKGAIDPAVTDRWTACLDADTLRAPLRMRPRTGTDRFQPQGMSSLVRLKDWMINVKVPRAVRDRLPLIEAGGQIVWVPGFRVGQPFIIGEETQRIVKLTFRKG